MEHLIRDYRRADNQGLADMWNESQTAWPTGFGGSVAFTAERVARDMAKLQALFHLVAENQGRITGYCWVSSYPKEPDACYVALLNAHPTYHGQGVGKELLLESIRRACRLGYYRVDLNTWPSNIKAVPLYKKTGFFWLPDTQVHMQNYIPAVLGHPLCRGFFARHDWYRTFVRNLDQEPDEIRRGKRRVFPYRFQSGEEYVEVTFDMESRRVCAVEANGTKASLVLEDPDVVVGRRHLVRCQCQSTGPSSVAWRKQREPEVRLKPVGGQTAELRIGPEARAPEDSMPALKVGARVSCGGERFDLSVGFRPKQPVEIEWFPKHPSALAGKCNPVSLRIRNNLDNKVTLSIERGKNGAAGAITGLGKSLEPHGMTGGTVRIERFAAGVSEFRLKATVRKGGERLSSKTFRMPVFDIGSDRGGVLWRSERETVWETGCFRAIVTHRGGEIELIDKQTGQTAAYLDSTLGPPFWPSEFANIERTVRLHRGVLTVAADSQQSPGLRFEIALRPVEDRVIEVGHRVVNGTKAKGCYQVDLSSGTGGGSPRSRRVVPLRHGCIEIAGPTPFGSLGEELPKDPKEYSESWWATESGGRVSGLVWRRVKRLEYPGLLLDVGDLNPGEARGTEACFLVFGAGDHELVRRWFLGNVKGEGPDDYLRMEVRPRISATFDPPILFAVPGVEGQHELTVDNLSNQELDVEGGVAVANEAGGRSDPFRGSAVKMGNPSKTIIGLEPKVHGPSVGKITARAGTNPIDAEFGIVLWGGSLAPVTVERAEEQGLEVWAIDNGTCRFKASPQFLGSLFSWKHHGAEQLLTAFPKPGNFSWDRPWYGGIAPVIQPPDGWGRNMLAKERFISSPEKAQGVHGLPWQGVRMSCRARDRKLRGLEVDISYLTLPNCPLLAVRLRLRNATRGYFHLSGEVMGFVSPGGSHRSTVLKWDALGRERRVLRGDKGSWTTSERWAEAHNPENGVAVTVAIPRGHPPQAAVLIDYGRDGGHLGQAMDVRLKAGEAKEYLAFWGVAGNPDEALAFRHLSELKELP